ncbi:MAG: hypothetical protein Q7S14_02520 [bacterium]|nr:hypothetical protein [bacterium]
MDKNNYATKDDLKALEESLTKTINSKNEPVLNLLNTVLKEIQDFREESTILRSLHSRVCDLEDIHPDNAHKITQQFVT